jgi:hypothetical protein
MPFSGAVVVVNEELGPPRDVWLDDVAEVVSDMETGALEDTSCRLVPLSVMVDPEVEAVVPDETPAHEARPTTENARNIAAMILTDLRTINHSPCNPLGLVPVVVSIDAPAVDVGHVVIRVSH